MRISAVAALVSMLSCAVHAAPAAETTAAAAAPEAAARVERSALFGLEPIESGRLAKSRGGTQVLNDMKLKGTVANNQASNLVTGNNIITDGSLAGASGLPMVIQNSGNNVLIQSATIVNVQMK